MHKQQISMKSEEKKWCLAFPEPDQSVVARSIHHAKTKENLPYNFNVKNYMVFGSLITAIVALLIFVCSSFLVTLKPIRILFVRVRWIIGHIICTSIQLQFLQFPKLFSFGIATKTGPNKKVMENGRMLLTFIGYGSTTIQSTTNSNKIKHGARKTIVKVIFRYLNLIARS